MAKKITIRTEIVETVELVDKDIDWINKHRGNFEVKGFKVVKLRNSKGNHTVILSRTVSIPEYIEQIKHHPVLGKKKKSNRKKI